MFLKVTPELIQPLTHFINNTILAPLSWEEFSHSFNAYLTRRKGKPAVYVDLFPTLACMAAGGSSEQAIPVTAAWVLFVLAARLFDDLADDQQLAQEWQDVDSQTKLAMALFALGAANSAVAQIPSGAVCKEISYALNQALALAAKVQQVSTGANSTEQYLSTIAAKTGFVFAVGAWSGGMVALNSPCQSVTKPLYDFGLNIGIMDQIIDDCQDLPSDLAQGIWTLPVIYAVAKASEKDRPNLLTVLEQAEGGGNDALNTAVSHIAIYDSLAWCLTAAAAYQKRALNALQYLPDENTIYLVEYAQRNDPTPVI